MTTDAPRTALSRHIVAGCDGFHGVSRHGIPAGNLITVECNFAYSWLGIPAQGRTKLGGTHA
ncbi:MAG: hypothetical protein M0Z91_02795 [Actinomycetota bacterium]|nr:hypothetical protein [Actinomycetota bacterium]